MKQSKGQLWARHPCGTGKLRMAGLSCWADYGADNVGSMKGKERGSTRENLGRM